MKITNKLFLPEALVRAVANDSYNRGDCDFSVTELISPPRIRALRIKHKDEITEDAADRIYSLLGQSIHTILERANNPENAIAEKRYFAKFGRFVVSTQVDSLDLEGGTLRDYKCTTSYKFLAGKPPDPDWVAQTNMQLEILRRNGLDARALEIVGILRDWQQSKLATDPNYPNFQVARHDIQMWSREETTAYIENRIALHVAAEYHLPQCAPVERWETPTRYAIMSGKQKRALRLVDTVIEAQAYVAQLGAGLRIEVRRGESKRCERFCDVNKFCDYYNNQIKGAVNDERENDKEV